MVALYEISPAQGTGRNATIWIRCPDCGKERWADLVVKTGQPNRKSLRCADCNHKFLGHLGHLRAGQGHYNWKGGISIGKAEKAYKKEYERLHSEERPIISARWRAKTLAAEGDFSVEEWRAVKEKQGYRCARCGKAEPTIALTVDHIKPLSLGGSNFIDNIQALCKSCNSLKMAIDGSWRRWKEGVKNGTLSANRRVQSINHPPGEGRGRG